MARAYICAFFTWLDQLKSCTDEELGRLLRASLIYGRDGTIPSFPEGSKESIVWGFLQTQIDGDIARYDKKAAAGKKGAEKRWQTSANATPQKSGADELLDLKQFINSMSDASSK